MTNEEKLARLLVRWVQMQVARHEMYGEPVSSLEEETIARLKDMGLMKNGVWTL